MAHLFSRLFKKREMSNCNHPPSALHDFSQYDTEYITYCIEQEQKVSWLEAELHTTDDPEEIAKLTLKAVCDFYGADWASIIEVDLNLGVWTHGWWHNANPKVHSIQYSDDYESIKPMQRWVEAMNKSEPIIVPDSSDSSNVSSEEQQIYMKLHVQSVMAVPFGPNPAGFLVLRNITRYMGRTSAMNTFAYVLHRAMAQRDSINKAKMALSPDEIKNKNDVVINFFGDMEIQTMDGIWKESSFNSPKCSKTVAYILLHRKTSHSALAIADALYPEENTDIDTLNKNIRGYIYRFRKSLELILDEWLIEYSQNGYRVNPALHVTTDLQKFEHIWAQLQENPPLSHKIYLLKQAFGLYRGCVCASSAGDHWLVGIATEYKTKYINMVNELLRILADFQDYDGVQHFALQSLKLVPENVRAHYWLIYAMYHSGTVELAKKAFYKAKPDMTDDEFDTLRKYIAENKKFQYEEFLDE